MASVPPLRMAPPPPPGTSRPEVEDMGLKGKSATAQPKVQDSMGMESRAVQEGLGITAANNKQILEEKAAAEAKLQAGKDKPDGNVKTKAGGKPKLDSEMPEKPKLDWSDKFKGFTLADVLAMFLEIGHNIEEDKIKMAQFTQKSRKYWSAVRTHGDKLKTFVNESVGYIGDQQKALMEIKSIQTEAMADLKDAQSIKDDLTSMERELELMEKVKGPPSMEIGEAVKSVKRKVSGEEIEELKGLEAQGALDEAIAERRQTVESMSGPVNDNLESMKERVADLEKKSQTISRDINDQRRYATQLSHEYGTHMEAATGTGLTGGLTRMLVRQRARHYDVDLAGTSSIQETMKKLGVSELGQTPGHLGGSTHTKKYTEEMHGQLEARVEALAKMEENMNGPGFRALPQAERMEAREKFVEAVKEFKVEYAAIATLVKPEEKLQRLNMYAQGIANEVKVSLRGAIPPKEAAALKSAEEKYNGLKDRHDALTVKVKATANPLEKRMVQLSVDGDESSITPVRRAEIDAEKVKLNKEIQEIRAPLGKLGRELNEAGSDRRQKFEEAIDATVQGTTRQLELTEKDLKENEKKINNLSKKSPSQERTEEMKVLLGQQKVLVEQQHDLRERLTGPLAEISRIAAQVEEQEKQLRGVQEGHDVAAGHVKGQASLSGDTNAALGHKEATLDKSQQKAVEFIQKHQDLISKGIVQGNDKGAAALEKPVEQLPKLDQDIRVAKDTLDEIQNKLATNADRIRAFADDEPGKAVAQEARDKLLVEEAQFLEQIQSQTAVRDGIEREMKRGLTGPIAEMKALEAAKVELLGRELNPSEENPVLKKMEYALDLASNHSAVEIGKKGFENALQNQDRQLGDLARNEPEPKPPIVRASAPAIRASAPTAKTKEPGLMASAPAVSIGSEVLDRPNTTVTRGQEISREKAIKEMQTMAAELKEKERLAAEAAKRTAGIPTAPPTRPAGEGVKP